MSENREKSDIESEELVLIEHLPFAENDEIAESLPAATPVQIQQEYFENNSDCDWKRYKKHNWNYMIQNLAFALYGCPSIEGELTEMQQNDHDVILEGYTSRQKEQVLKVYEKICEQSKYSLDDDEIVMTELLVVCAKPKPLHYYQVFEPSDYWINLHIRNDVDIFCTAVFKIRKCIATTAGAKCCRVYVDENARVYHDWDSYLLNNTLPKCVLIVPEGGDYKGEIIEGDGNFAVKLTVAPSPTLGIKARVLSTVDTASTFASLGAIGVIGAAAFTPVGPAVIVGATVAGVATGLYGVVRSSFHLHDRSMHEQSISPTDGEARGSWLNIAASSVGIAAGAASGLLSKSAAAGTHLSKTGQAIAFSVELLRHANIVTGGAGVVNSLYHIILKYHKHKEMPTSLELFQFTSATLFFCHAVMSNRTAQNIIEEAQIKTINEYRSTLRSNRHRKIFDKISAETRRVQGVVEGNTDVIKSIKTIANKDQYFADVLKINKDLNTHKLRISMTSDGAVNLNGQHKFNPSDLRSLDNESRSKLFTSLGPDTLTSRNVSTIVSPNNVNAVKLRDFEDECDNHMLVNIRPEEVLRIGSMLVRVSMSGANNISQLLENLSEEAYSNLMTVSFNLLSKLLPENIAKLKLLSPEADLTYQIVEFVFNYIKHQRPLGEPDLRSDNDMTLLLKEFFQDGIIKKETILHLKDKLLVWIDEQIDKHRVEHPNKKPIVCTLCEGVRYA